jgi:uncharacterized protein YdiU (UPF0061 family)
MNTLHALRFDNRFINHLPEDSNNDSTCRQVFNACYSKVLPQKVSCPKLVSYSPEVAQLLDLTAHICESEEFSQVFAGNQLVNGMQPYATCYGGHQFGQWAGQLGDGRAINLGEIINSQKQRLTLQLKGGGKTPYSRSSDGLAVLRSSVREFLCSEAMHHLGVPTTRALSLVLTGESVLRDMFYDGNRQYEKGAVVCRVAQSFTRFGHFQIHAARNNITLLKQLVDYTISTDFPHLGTPSVETYLHWFSEVCQKTAEMIIHWQRVGFVHGVMNTDNMSILGLTIDYGPYGWLEDFNLNWTPNTTDADHRRYHFGNQPRVAFWNLAQLANAIFPLIEESKPLQDILEQHYTETFQRGYEKMMAEKLGLDRFDETLISDLMTLLQTVETDMTIFYRQLANIDMTQTEIDTQPLTQAYYDEAYLGANYQNQLNLWLKCYARLIQIDEVARKTKMNAVNPNYVLRNYLSQQAIDAAEEGDFSEIERLLNLLRKPYDEQLEFSKYAKKRPEWAKRKAGCSMLSCSS